MPLNFIMGPSGSGKTYHLFHRIIAESMKHPDQNYIVLVPEQFTLSTQKELVRLHPRRGIMNIDVLSFARLAFRVFEETGKGGLPVLDDEGKNLVLRKIAVNHEEELVVLKGNMRKLGYISEVKSVLSELVQYDIHEAELDQVCAACPAQSRLYYKLQDIKVLYRGFEDYLAETYTTKEEVLDTLSSLVSESAMLKNSTIALDGYTGFTPVQNRLLGQLLGHCRDVFVTATIDEHEDPYVFDHPYQLFGLTKKMVSSLVAVARENRVEIAPPKELFRQPVYRFRANPQLDFLAANIFRDRRRGTAGAAPGEYLGLSGEKSRVRLQRAANPQQEALQAARAIRSLVRRSGYRYKDIGVVVADLPTYADYLKQGFALYEIPAFIDQKKSILYNPVVACLRSFLSLFKEQFSYESVFRLLKTDLLDFERPTVEALENYCLARGIRGFKRWNTPWAQAAPAVEAARQAFIERMAPYRAVFGRRHKTVTDITRALYAFLVQEQLQQKLARREQWFNEQGELALAREYGQLYRIIIELLDKLVALLGPEPVGLPEYIMLLDAGLDEAKVGVVPPSVDQIVVGDLTRTRFGEIKALFFLGANDAFIPGSLTGHGLLSERDKEAFARQHLSLSPSGKEQAFTQKFYLYTCLVRPSERLWVSYSSSTNEGEAARPSYLVRELQKLFPALASAPTPAPAVPELTPESGFLAVIQSFWQPDGALTPAAAELYSWYFRQPEYRPRLLRLVQARYYRRRIADLPAEQAAALYGRDFRESISRIENFDNCAYAHFLRYGLRLQEREEYAFAAFDLGNICHRALEQYARRLQAERLTWEQVPDAQQGEFLDEALTAALAEHRNDVLQADAQQAFLATKMRRLLDQSVWALTAQLAAGDFAPEYFEERFDRGIIDRIDICREADRVYVKVLDYKTGTKSFDITEVYYGLQLQLMFYMKAALRKLAAEPANRDKQIIPAGAFYYQVQNPLVEKAASPADLDEQRLKEMKPSGLMNDRTDSLGHLARDKSSAHLVTPLKYNKDGSLAKTARNQLVSEADFTTIIDYTTDQVAAGKAAILAGQIRPEPIKTNARTGCDFCAYRHICGFDPALPGYAYRELPRLDLPTALAKMKGETDDGNEVDDETAAGH